MLISITKVKNYSKDGKEFNPNDKTFDSDLIYTLVKKYLKTKDDKNS